MNCTSIRNVWPGASATVPMGPLMVTCLTVVQLPSWFFLKASHGNRSILTPPSGDYTPLYSLVKHLQSGRMGVWEKVIGYYRGLSCLG